MRLFVDGENVASRELSGFAVSERHNAGHVARLGRHARNDRPGATHSFARPIDDFTVFERALIPGEIRRLVALNLVGASLEGR